MRKEDEHSPVDTSKISPDIPEFKFENDELNVVKLKDVYTARFESRKMTCHLSKKLKSSMA